MNRFQELARSLKRLCAVAHPGQLLPAANARTFDLFDGYGSFITTKHGPTILDFSTAQGLHHNFYSPAQGESGHHVGGKRWSPTQEQLAVLEMLYRRGMRTPNAEQIDQITSQLVKYGRIEGKNVFYWFQNHKTRGSQKERLDGAAPKPSSSAATTTTSLEMLDAQKGNSEERGHSGNKRKSRSWLIDLEEESNASFEEEKQRKTLELFPLHPGR